MFLNSPLEQFQILPLINLYFGGFDFSITNSICITMIGLGSFLFLVNSLLLSPNESSLAFHSHFSVVPGRWQVIVEGLYEVIANMLKDIVGARG